MDKLTARQRQFLDFVTLFIEENSYPPTIREIQEHFGLRSTKGVKDHIDRLVEKGFLKRTDGAARALEVVSSVRIPPVVGIPLVGSVAAGMPLLAEENVQEYLPVSRSTARAEGMFMLRVSGDSMTGAAILDGDLVLVRPQPFVEQGEIAVVLLDDEATVKRFYRRGDSIELHAENPAYRPIVCAAAGSEVRVLGKVTAVFRELE